MSYSKTGRNYQSVPKKIVHMPVEQSISSTTEEEELKSNDTTSVVALGSGTPDMSQSLIRATESTYVLSMLLKF